MSFKFSERSLGNLLRVHPDLQRVISTALAMGEMDFTVTDGPRTKEEQASLYAQGRTKPGKIVTWTLDSKHLIQPDGYGYAVDVAPYPIDYEDRSRFIKLVGIIKRAAIHEGVLIECGADWQKPDLPHIQLVKQWGVA